MSLLHGRHLVLCPGVICVLDSHGTRTYRVGGLDTTNTMTISVMVDAIRQCRRVYLSAVMPVLIIKVRGRKKKDKNVVKKRNPINCKGLQSTRVSECLHYV